MYFRAIEIDSEHYYSLTAEDLEELIITDNDLKYQFFKIELDNYERMWTKTEFEEEYSYLIERCKGDQQMLDYVRDRVEKILMSK